MNTVISKIIFATLLVTIGCLYLMGVITDSAVVWSMASAVSVLNTILIIQRRIAGERNIPLVFLLLPLLILTVFFFRMPSLREKIIVLNLVLTNALILL